MKGDIIVGSTGEKLYAYRPARNDYKTADAPKDRVGSDKFPNPMRDVLQMQNVGLMCALVPDAGAFLAEGVKEVAKDSDATVAGTRCTVLAFKGDKMDYRVMLDAQSHLVRQVVMDMKPSNEASGRNDVERAWLTVDFTRLQPRATLAAEQICSTTPQGAK